MEKEESRNLKKLHKKRTASKVVALKSVMSLFLKEVLPCDYKSIVYEVCTSYEQCWFSPSSELMVLYHNLFSVMLSSSNIVKFELEKRIKNIVLGWASACNHEDRKVRSSALRSWHAVFYLLPRKKLNYQLVFEHLTESANDFFNMINSSDCSGFSDLCIDHTYRISLKSRVIDTISNFLRIDTALGNTQERIDRLILSIPFEESTEVALSKSIFRLTYRLWKSHHQCQRLLESYALHIFTHTTQSYSVDMPESFYFLIIASDNVSCHNHAVLNSSLEMLINKNNFIRGEHCLFHEFISAYSSKRNLEPLVVSSCIRNFLFRCDRNSEACLQSILRAIIWQRNIKISSFQDHVEAIFSYFIHLQKGFTKAEEKFIEALFVESFIHERLRGWASEFFDGLAYTILAHSESDPSTQSNIPGEENELQITQEVTSLKNLKSVCHLYFLKVYSPSKKVMEAMFKFIFTPNLTETINLQLIRPSLKATLVAMQKNNTLEHHPYLVPRVLEYMVDLRSTCASISVNSSLKILLFLVIAESQHALTEYRKIIDEFSIEEISIGLRKGVTPEVFLNSLTASIKKLNRREDWEKMCQDWNKFGLSSLQTSSNTFIEKGLGFMWDKGTFELALPLLSHNHESHIMSLLASDASLLTQQNISDMFTKGIINKGTLVSLLERYLYEVKTATLDSDPRMWNWVTFTYDSRTLSEMHAQTVALSDLIIRNLHEIELELIVQCLPLIHIESHAILLEKMVLCIEQFDLPSAKSTLQNASVSEKNEWGLYVQELIYKYVKSKCWIDAVSEHSWNSFINDGHFISLGTIYFPRSSHAHAHKLLEEQCKICSGVNYAKLSFILGSMLHAGDRSISFDTFTELADILIAESIVSEAQHCSYLLSCSQLILIGHSMNFDHKELRQFSIGTLVKYEKVYGIRYMNPRKIINNALFQSNCMVLHSVLQLLHAVSNNCPEVEISRSSWKDIGSLFIGIEMWILSAGYLINQSMVFEVLIDDLSKIRSHPFLTEAVHCFYSTDTSSILQMTKYLIFLLEVLQDDKTYLLKKSSLVFFSLMRAFHQVCFGNIARSSTHLRGTALLQQMELYLDDMKAPPEDAHDLHWICFLTFCIFVVRWAFAHASCKQEGNMIGVLRTKDTIKFILNALSRLLCTHNSTRILRASDSFNLCEEVEIITYATTVLRELCGSFPLLVNQWCNDAPLHVRAVISKIISDGVSSDIISSLIRKIRLHRSVHEADIDCSATHDTCEITLKRNGETIQLLFTFHATYPIKPVEPTIPHLESRRTILGLTRQQLRSLLLIMRKKCHNFVNFEGIVDFWVQKLKEQFDHKPSCLICFNVLHTDTKQFPDTKCNVCRNSAYHRRCLFDWFKKSGNNTCPTCRSSWRSKESFR